jgi:DNA repair exonuclease SbcCD ATPase subunit
MIRFEKVRFKNFGSFGNNFTEIQLNRHRSCLVSGLNGHGKSFALLDSITFALFGKPFRKVNIPQLPNTVNEKDCVVEVEFSVGELNYLVRRGLKPKVFEIYKNGKMIDQNAKTKDYQVMLEDQILRMNYKSFTQVVILGISSFVPFMQLSAADRRDVIEDILDIQVFSQMNSLLKTKTAKLKSDLTDLNRDLTINKERAVATVALVQSLQRKSAEERDGYIIEIKDARQRQEDCDTEIEKIDERITEELAKITDEKNNDTRLKEYASLEKRLNRDLSQTKKEIAFYEKNHVCPTCSQSIPQDKAEGEKAKKNNQVTDFRNALDELQKMREKSEERQTEINDIKITIQELKDERIRVNTRRRTALDYENKIQGKLDALTGGEEGDIADAKKKLELTKDQRESLLTKKDDLLIRSNTHSNASELLKDSGIKAKVIRHYIPVINSLINKYLKEMEFFVSFELDENFNETIKSRHRDTFSYMSFSEGEKLRIDLAILLAWREVSRLKNSANTNLLILDEVFDASLDAGGSDDFLKLLQTLAEKNHIFVISHKSDQLADKFENQIGFQKVGNFSRII